MDRGRFLLGGLAVLGLASTSVHAQSKFLAIVEGVELRQPAGWAQVASGYRNVPVRLEKSASPGKEGVGRILVFTERRRNSQDAVDRLGQIADEYPDAQSRYLSVAGWPGLQRRTTVPLPKLGQEDKAHVDKAFEPREVLAIVVVTAVAVGDVLVRVEGTVTPETDLALADEVERVTTDLRTAKKPASTETSAALRRLRARTPPKSPEGGPAAKAGKSDESKTGVAASVQAGVGELEVATSANGQTVVVAANSGWSFSTNGGQTYAFGGGTPGSFPRDGDPSLGVGQSGRFYYGFIGFPNGTAAAGGVTGCSTGIATSANPTAAGAFTFRAHATLCTNPSPSPGLNTCFPDQEHIAADPVNAAPGSNDQVYSVWRNFLPSANVSSCGSIGSGSVTSSIVCSVDSGQNWTAATAIGPGDFPRVTVGRDGFVYVVFRSGGSVMLNKFSSCQSGLTQQVGFPVTVSAFTDVVCAVPGLDRCNDGNVLSSPTVAVDDLDPAHVFVAFATASAAGNENILVRDSTDAGATFPTARVATLNTAVAARRFMPWACAAGGVAHVSWYDRRAATAAANDATAFFRGSASVKNGALTAGPELNLSGAADAQCASGWPSAPRAIGDSEGCSVQPQNAGFCRNPLPGTVSSLNRCDFSTGVCPPGETCRTGGGFPKFGDYNGIACGSGRIYSAWASATAPTGVTASGPGINVYADTGIAQSDFFVRDWTNSATDRDLGPEPSTNPVFWTTSDVWNRRSNTPGTFASDQPEHQDPGVSADNFAFVRVHRRAPTAPTAPAETVTARFFTADFGFGSNFVAIGPPSSSLAFSAADNSVVLGVGHQWTQPAGTSGHNCLAVVIEAAGDPPSGAGLAGMSAGAGGALMRGDNNKAQRNMGIYTGLMGGAATEYFAIIHNPDLEARDMEVNWEVVTRRRTAAIRVVGDRYAPSAFAAKGRLTLKAMQPGENRWLALSHAPLTAEGIVVNFFEPKEAGRSNGFTIAVQPKPLVEALRENLAFHAAVFGRMHLAFGVKGAAEQARLAESLLKEELVAKNVFGFLSDQSNEIGRIAVELSKLSKDEDGFRVAHASRALVAASKVRTSRLVQAHASLLHRLDALQTRIQKAKGDVADVVQIARLHERLFEGATDVDQSKALAAVARTFLASMEESFGTDFSGYTKFVRESLDPLDAVTAGRGDNELASRFATLRTVASSSDDLAAVEAAHRGYLLRLRDLLRRP